MEILDRESLTTIIRLLDLNSASALAQTNTNFNHMCSLIHGQAANTSWQGQHTVTGPPSTSTSPSALTFMALPDAGSPSSDDDSLGTTHTGITTPDEDEWIFKVTPDLIRRLSLLPQHNKGSALERLPTELHLEIFKYLDKIDSVCLGLASPKIYPFYRAIHGVKMPLNTRRVGPNSLESAWEVVGKQICNQCGLYRCELHQHIKTWMPRGLEYCAFKQNFGTAAAEHANTTCYRGKPSKPKRCGRHPLRTTSVHQDDAFVGLAMTPIA